MGLAIKKLKQVHCDLQEIFSDKMREHVNPIQDEHFRGCSRMWEAGQKAPLSKFCHTYPTMMKLGAVIQ